jgi:hypothetical protein
MIYHRRSLVGAMLWARYALAVGKPWTNLDALYARFLESPGTKAYSRSEALALCAPFSEVELKVQLGPGDLLEGVAGQRHQGRLLAIAKRVWPRRLIRRVPGLGLFLLIRATR